jgi:hypothetical protein
VPAEELKRRQLLTREERVVVATRRDRDGGGAGDRARQRYDARVKRVVASGNGSDRDAVERRGMVDDVVGSEVVRRLERIRIGGAGVYIGYRYIVKRYMRAAYAGAVGAPVP